MKRAFGAILSFIFILIATPKNVRGVELYLDTGVGLSQLRGSDRVFGNSEGISPSLGFGLGTLLGLNFTNQFRPIQLHLGLGYRVFTSSGDTSQFSFQIPYGLLRLETYRIYWSAGISPYVFGTDTQSAITPSSKIDSLAILGQVGLLWRVVPFFHLALEGTVLWNSLQAGGVSPRFAWDGAFVMRFFIIESGRKKGSARNYDGWRYPFGIRL